jgi:hypothetical protein
MDLLREEYLLSFVDKLLLYIFSLYIIYKDIRLSLVYK